MPYESLFKRSLRFEVFCAVTLKLISSFVCQIREDPSHSKPRTHAGGRLVCMHSGSARPAFSVCYWVTKIDEITLEYVRHMRFQAYPNIRFLDVDDVQHANGTFQEILDPCRRVLIFFNRRVQREIRDSSTTNWKDFQDWLCEGMLLSGSNKITSRYKSH